MYINVYFGFVIVVSSAFQVGFNLAQSTRASFCPLPSMDGFCALKCFSLEECALKLASRSCCLCLPNTHCLYLCVSVCEWPATKLAWRQKLESRPLAHCKQAKPSKPSYLKQPASLPLQSNSNSNTKSNGERQWATAATGESGWQIWFSMQTGWIIAIALYI